MKKKLLIIVQRQFGYHSDTYYYCKYLRRSFDITYICWDYAEKRIEMNGVEVIYISRNGNIPQRNLRFILSVLKQLKQGYEYTIVKYFRGCCLLRVCFPKQKFLLDIRSGAIDGGRLKRSAYNLGMVLESNFYKTVSIISASLAAKLGLTRKATILPLGADIISETCKTFDRIDLLYVGTLHNRRIEKTIKGFSRFYREYAAAVRLRYTIVGSGYGREVDELKALVKTQDLQDAVIITGRIPHDRLKRFFDTRNIGVSFIPQTDYFDVQPPTKTFEYLLSGMPVMATATAENILVITRENGIIIEDTPEGFYRGLVALYSKIGQYQSGTIRKESMGYTWKQVMDKLTRILEHL